jgi:formamidopyrimidine-DNA glycosylase
VHLGLFGKYRVYRGDAPEPQGALRMRLRTVDDAESITVDLRGPTACSVGPPDDRDAILARLGPDPLRPDAEPSSAIDRIGRSRKPIGALLLDQAVVAGIGNVYRAELLFVHGIHPNRPGTHCSPEEISSLWQTAGDMLRAGVKANRIVTVDRDEIGWPRNKRIPRREATYVYGRDLCVRCGGRVLTLDVANRTCYYCPTDQPR